MAYSKDVYTSVEVEVDIEFDDVIGYIQNGLTDDEATGLAKEIRQVHPKAGSLNFTTSTIMEDLAANELQEIINKHGVEAVVAQLKNQDFYA